MLHGRHADLGADHRFAGGIDHHVDQITAADQLRILRDGNVTVAHGLVEGTLRVRHPVRSGCVTCVQQRGQRAGNVDVGDGRYHDALHVEHLRHDVATHHAGADEADANGFTGEGAGF